jgi:hypothetical protein
MTSDERTLPARTIAASRSRIGFVVRKPSMDRTASPNGFALSDPDYAGPAGNQGFSVTYGNHPARGRTPGLKIFACSVLGGVGVFPRTLMTIGCELYDYVEYHDDSVEMSSCRVIGQCRSIRRPIWAPSSHRLPRSRRPRIQGSPRREGHGAEWSSMITRRQPARVTGGSIINSLPSVPARLKHPSRMSDEERTAGRYHSRTRDLVA